MTEEQQAAYIMAMAAVLNATVAGMVTANKQREMDGESQAYPESAFTDAINTSGCHHNSVIECFRG